MSSDEQARETISPGVDMHEEFAPEAGGRDAAPEVHNLEAQSTGVAAGEADYAALHDVPPRSGMPAVARKPRTYPRFRNESVGGPDPRTPLRRVLSFVEELERMLDERPDLVYPRAVMRRMLDEVELELQPQAATVWVPREDNTYEACESRGLEAAVGIRVPQGQSLFQSFTGDVDGVLIEPLDVSQRPVSGIPGLVGESLVAAALRLEREAPEARAGGQNRTLLGVVIATGTGFTSAHRGRLDLLVSRAAPDLAVAWLIERLRARAFTGGDKVPVRGAGAVSGTVAGPDLV